MSKEVITAREQDSVLDVLAAMRRNQGKCGRYDHDLRPARFGGDAWRRSDVDKGRIAF
jgi:hypothetical protein